MTVLVPARNEVDTIVGCIESIGRQDTSVERLQVLVIDGGSTDGTVDAARNALDQFNFADWEVVVNERPGTRPSNLNLGLQGARGLVLCRADARTRLPAGYVRRCLELLDARPDIVVVGGRQRAVCSSGGRKGAGVARAMNNRWAMGGAYYRRAQKAGAADTVYLGAFRTAELREVGGWDERLAANEDFDLNRRLAVRGQIWFDPSLEAEYIADSSLSRLARKFFGYGRGKVIYWRASKGRPQPRQLIIGLGFPLVVFGAVLALVSRRAWPALGVLVLGAAGVEYRGATSPSGDLLTHVYAIGGMGIIGGSWVGGLWVELVRWTRSRLIRAEAISVVAT